jgi:hypothetical protein
MSEPYTFRTIVCDAADQKTMQDLFVSMWGDEAVGMLVMPLSADGANPPTNYISTGMVPNTPIAQQLPAVVDGVQQLGSIPALRTWAKEHGFVVTLGTLRSAVNASDISNADPYTVMADLGLEQIYK